MTPVHSGVASVHTHINQARTAYLWFSLCRLIMSPSSPQESNFPMKVAASMQDDGPCMSSCLSYVVLVRVDTRKSAWRGTWIECASGNSAKNNTPSVVGSIWKQKRCAQCFWWKVMVRLFNCAVLSGYNKCLAQSFCSPKQHSSLHLNTL